jgi:Glutaredoxin-like domain (DUF836)
MNRNEAELNDRFRAWLGTGTMISASCLAILIMCDRMNIQFLPLPATWYASRQLHLLVCGAMFIMAAMLLKSPPVRTPARNGRPLFRSCRLLTRRDCGLCDEALAVLLRFQDALPAIEIVDIETDPQLVRQFGESIPVVELDDRVRFRGGVHPALLERLILAAELREQRTELQPGSVSAGDSGVFVDLT